MPLSIVILAAGQGTRMRSDLPKVLHPLAGQPLLEHVVTTARNLDAQDIHVVYGHGGEGVRTDLAHLQVNWVLQAEQLGTGHAVAQALPAIAADHTVLVLYGDVSLITSSTLVPLIDQAQHGALALLTATLADPHGYGRIVRAANQAVTRIVEQKDATEEELKITECNPSLYCFDHRWLFGALSQVTNNNSQSEYYLTDLLELAIKEGKRVETQPTKDWREALGVNTLEQLTLAEELLTEYAHDQHDGLRST